MKIDGRELAEKIYDRLTQKVSELKKKGITPNVTVILVGDDPASVAFIKQKQKGAERIGATLTLIQFTPDIEQTELINKVDELNLDPLVHGIIVQQPLPNHINIREVEYEVTPEKDIDGFHPQTKFKVPLALAVLDVLGEIFNQINPKMAFIDWLKSKNIVVIGKGNTGGGPTIQLLQENGVKPIVIDSKTENRGAVLKKADIIIPSVGKEGIVQPQDLKQGVILVGVGMYKNDEGKLKGDYIVTEIETIASFYTPVLGGVGPMNVACLMENLVKAAQLRVN